MLLKHRMGLYLMVEVCSWLSVHLREVLVVEATVREERLEAPHPRSEKAGVVGGVHESLRLLVLQKGNGLVVVVWVVALGSC